MSWPQTNDLWQPGKKNDTYYALPPHLLTTFLQALCKLLNMDPRKEATLLKFISILWQHDVFKMSQLKDFRFFLDILKLLDSEKHYSEKGVERRINKIQEFLQEYFNGQSDVRNFIDFEKVQNYECHWDADIELAKIAVVLIAVGVVSKSQRYFINCAMELPETMHSDTISLILSCMKADSSKIFLTHAIEKTLLQRSGDQEKYYSCSSPVASLCLYHKGSPLRKTSYKLKYNKDVLLTPFCNDRGSFYSVLSPLKENKLDLLTEPPVISSYQGESDQKELSKIKQQLNDEICLRDELQFQLKDLQLETSTQALKIFKLQERIKELLHFESAVDELQEVRTKLCEAEAYIVELQKTIKNFKTVFQDQIEEICFLSKELQLLKTEVKSEEQWKQKVNELEEIIKLKNSEIKFLEEENLNLKTESVEDNLRECFEETLVMNRSLREHLQSISDELTDAPNLKYNPECGLPIYFDIQLAELKEELNNARDEKSALQEELGLLKADNKKLKEKLDSLSVDADRQRETMLHFLRVKDIFIKKMKKILQKLRAELRRPDTRNKHQEGARYESKTAPFVRGERTCSIWSALSLNQLSSGCFIGCCKFYDFELTVKNNTLEIKVDTTNISPKCPKVCKHCYLNTKEKRPHGRKSKFNNVNKDGFVKRHPDTSHDIVIFLIEEENRFSQDFYQSNPKSSNLICLNEGSCIKENKNFAYCSPGNRAKCLDQEAEHLEDLAETAITGTLCTKDKTKQSPSSSHYSGPSADTAEILNCIYPDLAVKSLEHPPTINRLTHVKSLEHPPTNNRLSQCCADNDHTVSSPVRTVKPFPDYSRGGEMIKNENHPPGISKSNEDLPWGTGRPTEDHPLKSCSFKDFDLTERENCLQKEIKLGASQTNKLVYCQIVPIEELCKVPAKKELLLFRLLKKALAQLKNLNKPRRRIVQKNNGCFKMEPVLKKVTVNENDQTYDARLKRKLKPEETHCNQSSHANADAEIGICHASLTHLPSDFFHSDTSCDILDKDSSILLSDLSRTNPVSSLLGQKLLSYTDDVRSDGQEVRSMSWDISSQFESIDILSERNRSDWDSQTFIQSDYETSACQKSDSKCLHKKVSYSSIPERENSMIKCLCNNEVYLLSEAHRETKSVISSNLQNEIDICTKGEQLEHSRVYNQRNLQLIMLVHYFSRMAFLSGLTGCYVSLGDGSHHKTGSIINRFTHTQKNLK
ncbi:hypothetical protein Btru_013691 [Bulinus truncatus]|nr:hypothetical protein Btru_013691 [Bulinus truncatus]